MALVRPLPENSKREILSGGVNGFSNLLTCLFSKLRWFGWPVAFSTSVWGVRDKKGQNVLAEWPSSNEVLAGAWGADAV